MPGEAQDAQTIWDEILQEREVTAAEQSPTGKLTRVEETPDAVEQQAPNVEAASGEAQADPNGQPATGESQQAATPDPFEGLSPAVKARLEELDRLKQAVEVIPQLQQHIKTAEGRVAAMQREMDVAKAAAKTATEAPTKAQIAAASGDVQKWDALKADFPEWADATEQYLNARLAGLTLQQASGMTSEQVQQLLKDELAKTQVNVTRAIEEAKIEGKHEDWKTVINTDQFKTWFGKQPPEVQALASSTAGRDAIKLLDSYQVALKASERPAGEAQAGKEQRLLAAVTTRPNSSAPTGKTVEQMSPQELWEYERQQASKSKGTGGLVY